jgi:hypothetical protein
VLKLPIISMYDDDLLLLTTIYVYISAWDSRYHYHVRLGRASISGYHRLWHS